MGLERELAENLGVDTFECEKSLFLQGATRWFTLFYNNATNKFISYFERLISIENRQSLTLPHDI